MKTEKCCLNGCFQVLPVSAFARHPKAPDGLMARCRSCERDRLQLRKHSLTSADKASIAAAQGGCALCGRTEPGAKGWVVDHDHACCPSEISCAGCRRGVLCQWCNAALGYALDDPALLRRMANYLDTGTRLDMDAWNEGSHKRDLTRMKGSDSVD